MMCPYPERVSGPTRTSLVGDLVDGRYRVLEDIAEGGMATVHLAIDERLDREVALKVLRPHLAADEVFAGRFRREARSVARIVHPNVVAIHDQGQDGERMFLVMEYVPGRNLRDLIREDSPVSPRSALDLVEPVLEALSAAHRRGIIHRDIKPENVLLHEDGMVKVADFGLARAVTSTTTTGTTSVLLGTVAYLSPEQVERGVADARSDVYATGLMLFELLTGRAAIVGETPMAVAYQHVHGGVPSVSSLNDSVPQALSDLVARATARDPDDRPADATAFLAELRAVRQTLTADELDSRPMGVVAVENDEQPTLRTTALPVNATKAMPHANGGEARDSGPQRDSGPGRDSESVDAQTGPQDHLDTERPGRTWTRSLIVAGVAVLIAAVAAGFWFGPGPGGVTTVPANLVGASSAQARTSVEGAGLTWSTQQIYSESVPRGRVIATDPSAGARTRKGSTLLAQVSRGPERFTVPDLGGRTWEEATAAIERANLVVGSRVEEFNDTVGSGRVIRTDPKAGTDLQRGTTVNLVVSRGREPVPLPDLKGRNLKDARKDLTALGLKVETLPSVYDPQIPKDAVVKQEPGPSQVYVGDTVRLTGSKGPEMVTVPNVQGKQLDEAKRELTAAGFTVKEEKFLGGIYGTVRSVEPRGGSKAPKGSEVTLIVI